ncbi:kinase-like domain-containing protein [Fomitopsis serialis]|uniref:kinase-like domain-containing protein n=1 Tax=Fomitopsis serialis TaxID=139415 RepID=UPI002008AE6C|nr:kinase-like domain-containing protein [Neoantrodia serialis]KAH9927337.1 kinase-like domain-containing protein [Neoantrodia serialis]
MVHFSAILPSFSGKVIAAGHLRLQLLEPLGHGAYGVVYRALDLNSSLAAPAYFAVKCLLRHPEDSEYFCLQQREIAYHKAVCSHPNVLKLHQVIEETDFIFLLLDYCPGGDLFSAIIDHGVFKKRDDRVKHIFLQILDAVHHCHHLDEVFVSDFGLATTTRVSSAFGCGSSFYISPECIGRASRGIPFLNAVSDIWSLGVILTNMITGRNPWTIACALEDPAFIAYSRDPDGYIRRMLPMSPAARRILLRIFTQDPCDRITLPELRTAILDADTFFLNEEEELVFELEHQLTKVDSVDITDVVLQDRPESSESDLELVEIRPLPTPPLPEADTDASVRAIFTPSSRPPCIPISSDDRGPVTPEQYAVIADTVSIPELHLPLSKVAAPELFGPVDTESDITDGELAVHTLRKRKVAKSWGDRVVGAVHKIRILGQ